MWPVPDEVKELERRIELLRDRQARRMAAGDLDDPILDAAGIAYQRPDRDMTAGAFVTDQVAVGPK